MGDNGNWVETNQNDNPVIATSICLQIRSSIALSPTKTARGGAPSNGGEAVEIYGGEPGWDRVFLQRQGRDM